MHASNVTQTKRSPVPDCSNGSYVRQNLKTICFHISEAGERGTAKATFDYAFYARKLYGFHSLIFFPSYIMKLGIERCRISLDNFLLKFPVIIYNANNSFIGGPDLATKLCESGCDMLYSLKSGEKNSHPAFPLSSHPCVPTAIHAVFKWEPHGNAYAAIANQFSSKANPVVVPHIVSMPNDKFNDTSIRNKYHIPLTSLVLCRHGGYDTFDIKFVRESFNDLIAMYPELHFIFMNTNSVLMNSSLGTGQIHFLNATSDEKRLESFFSACDVMLHARRGGEKFGLAIAEFSIRNKPVITYKKSKDKEHILILGSKGFYYRDRNDLQFLVRSFITKGIPKTDYNAYRNFSPEIVMKKFKKVFIDPILTS